MSDRTCLISVVLFPCRKRDERVFIALSFKSAVAVSSSFLLLFLFYFLLSR